MILTFLLPSGPIIVFLVLVTRSPFLITVELEVEYRCRTHSSFGLSSSSLWMVSSPWELFLWAWISRFLGSNNSPPKKSLPRPKNGLQSPKNILKRLSLLLCGDSSLLLGCPLHFSFLSYCARFDLFDSTE
eukprot:TRINITY_DN1368_c0_g1_i8.p3 TRINITY_DN1368_c0_g1~~TRINITY_DN1368_c0_g1_i8.p3  ORF type:complete len:131 (-),score=11.88 TRINITY_DN1368_c0_g1_i8:133-525(-)